MEHSILSLASPIPLVELAWGSISTNSVLFSAAARQEARLTAVVVLPTPPFWLDMAIFLAKEQSPLKCSFYLYKLERQFRFHVKPNQQKLQLMFGKNREIFYLTSVA